MVDEENRGRATAYAPARKQRRRPALALGTIAAAITGTAVSPSHGTECCTVESTRGLVGDNSVRDSVSGRNMHDFALGAIVQSFTRETSTEIWRP